jgi:hypothetical protein
MDSMEERMQRYLQSMIEEEQKELSENADKIEHFKKLCAKKGFQLTDNNFNYIQTIGIVASYPNILSFLNPNIENDKEGLVKCDLLNKHFVKKELVSGYFYDTDYMVMAHPYFRRGFYENSNFAPRFIEFFWGLKKPELDLYIAIDFNRVRINVDDSVYMELDTWYGARFNKEIHQIPDDVSKHRPPLDLDKHLISFFFRNAYSLDTLWETKNGIKTFQAEEFKTEDEKITINGNDYFPARYIHAEFDLNKKIFRHFDGAVHLYNESEYYQRRDSDFNYNSKHALQIKSNSRKIFKMNGVVDVDTLILFASHFFTGNPLIIEYFEGEYPEYIAEMIEKARINRNNQ